MKSSSLTEQPVLLGAAAHQEAAALGAAEVRTEHLLLGVLRVGEGPGASALASLGVGLEAARRCVVERRRSGISALGLGEDLPPVAAVDPAELAMDRPATRALERAMSVALRRRERPVTDRHLLLALLDQASGGASNLLSDLDVDRAELLRLLH